MSGERPFSMIKGGKEDFEKMLAQEGEGKKENNPTPGQWIEVRPDGVLRVPDFGDINDPYNGDALELDPKTGLNKIQTWLEVETGTDGRFTKARLKDAKAYNDFKIGQHEHALDILSAGESPLEAAFFKITSSVNSDKISQEEFNGILEELSGSIAELRDQISGWTLKRMKTHTGQPNEFRLEIEFHPEVTGRFNKRGTFADIMSELQKLAKKSRLYAVSEGR